MSTPYKFGWKPEAPEPYRYPGIWASEKTAGPDRLAIAPPSGHVALLKELLSALAEPLGILYVLKVPRSEHAAGRYQSPEPMDRAEAEAFLHRFERFLEDDGRHHLWVMSMSGPELLVYDNHNVIYAYGQLDTFLEIVRRRALTQADVVRFPFPHMHNYNSEFDGDEQAMLHLWDWKYFPLQKSDE